MTLTEAYERLQHARDMNGILPGDAVDVILGARCETCNAFVNAPVGGSWCQLTGISVMPDHSCRAWEKREETA